MTTKGYLRKTQDAKVLHCNLRRLSKAGIPHSSIIVGGDIVKVIDSLSCGDCLVAPSVVELSPQSSRQQMLLVRIAQRGVTFRPLDKVGAEPEPEKESLLSTWLCRLGILRRREEEPQPSTLQLSEEMLARVMRCLKLYYQLKVRVETICAEQEISPKTLYQFLREKNLPSRREVKANPPLNPLRRPGFPDILFWKDPDDEKDLF